jgi:hypothetical protein
MLTCAKLDSALKNRILCRFMKRSPTTAFSLPVLTERPHPTRLFRQNTRGPRACDLCMPGVENPGAPGHAIFACLGWKEWPNTTDQPGHSATKNALKTRILCRFMKILVCRWRLKVIDREHLNRGLCRDDLQPQLLLDRGVESRWCIRVIAGKN